MRSYILLRNILVALTILFLGGTNLSAQVKAEEINPTDTNPAIETVHGPHLAMYDGQVPSVHRLFLFIVGTSGKATGSRVIDSIFATMGYHAISLDYENNVVAASLVHSKDTAAFDNYREEIITGAQVSSSIKVDSANSILNRFQKLLVYLVKHDPEGGWSEYVKNNKPLWSRIIVAGHSQGSGHAAYIGKMFKVDRVLMFSGPQDYLDDLHMPAPWQVRKGVTPPSRYFAFLHMKDPFNVNNQIANCMALLNISQPDTLMVNPGEEIHGHQHIIINDIPTKSPHGSTVQPVFKNVWGYMLSAEK